MISLSARSVLRSMVFASCLLAVVAASKADVIEINETKFMELCDSDPVTGIPATARRQCEPIPRRFNTNGGLVQTSSQSDNSYSEVETIGSGNTSFLTRDVSATDRFLQLIIGIPSIELLAEVCDPAELFDTNPNRESGVFVAHLPVEKPIRIEGGRPNRLLETPFVNQNMSNFTGLLQN